MKLHISTLSSITEQEIQEKGLKFFYEFFYEYKKTAISSGYQVSAKGLEPMTPSTSRKCSPS